MSTNVATETTIVTTTPDALTQEAVLFVHVTQASAATESPVQVGKDLIL